MVSTHYGDVKKILPEIIHDFDSIQVAFLDASHMYDDVIFEFETIYPKLHNQSIVLFDNMYLIAEKGEDQRDHDALEHIQKTYGGNLINLEFVSWFTTGLALWQRRPFRDD